MTWTKALTLGLLAAPSADAAVSPYEVMFENGSTSNRVNIVIVGDGYQEHEISTAYADHANDALDYFFSNALSSPFPRYQSFFNAYRVNVVSNESGADDPSNSTYVDTALDASYSWNGGVDRLLYFNTSKASVARRDALTGTGIFPDIRLGTVNSTKYGGGGGSWAVWAGGSSSAKEIAAHEIGHSFADLADEYWTAGTTYTGGEFSEWNATNSSNSGKWDRWLGYVDSSSSIGPIGYYEGGRYNEFGVYRPSNNSKMRSLNRPFDAVSREKFIFEIYLQVDPLDSWLSTSGVRDGSEPIWVDRVDDSVIALQWFIDGQLISETSDTLDMNAQGLASGVYDVQVRAYDSILDHSFTGSSLDWWRLDQDMLEQTLSWQVEVTSLPTGDLNGDGQVTNGDISAFVQVLTDPAGYANAFPGLNPNQLGDFTGDGLLTNGDIAGFVEALTGAGGTVPEPASLALLGLGGLLVVRRIGPDR